ncbi:MAG: signal peptide peptidase SppA [Bacteroidales bacterium]
MKTFFTTLLASVLGTVIAGIILFFLAFVVIAGLIASAEDEGVTEINKNSVLMLDFSSQITDRDPGSFRDFDLLSMQVNKGTGLNTILNNIQKAAKDENIDGIFLKLNSLDAGVATIEEIRNALIDFKKSDKFIISYSDVYTQGTYYLASVSDKIYTNPQGGMEFVGLSMQVMFFKRALEKFGIEPVIIRHGKFKSAVEPFLLEKMSQANEEQLSGFITSIWDHILKNISAERKIEVEKLNEIADNLLLRNAKSATDLGLIDSLKYYDEVLLELKSRTKAESIDDIEFVSLSTYTKVPEKKEDKEEKGLARDKVAVVYASGDIVMGKGDETSIGAESFSYELRKLRNDEKVKAIVLRINSPGGSALASEIIWREVKLMREKKPVIVSMGDYAASGGYYIACAADTIVADPTTLTGSIGVFGLLFNFQKLLNEKIGITFDRVNTNKYSDIGSSTRKMEKDEEMYIQGGIEEVYTTFINHVAEGRGLRVQTVDSIGQGRIWSGTDAIKIGLVDTLGGLQDAVNIAARKAKLKKFRTINYPQAKDPLESIIEMLEEGVSSDILKNDLGTLEPYIQTLKKLSNQKGIQARLPFEIFYN